MPHVRLLLISLTLAVLCALPTASSHAQTQDTMRIQLAPIEVVSATPYTLRASEAPFAISSFRRTDADLAGQTPLTLDEITFTLPGVWINNRENYSTGERIMIRGMGWRAAFGVRGVQVILDGIPLTMADGQSMLNVVDPGFIREVEVLRGPAATFWGNSSGGVLYLSSRPDAPQQLQAQVRQTVGAFGLSKTDVQIAPALGRHQLHGYASYFNQNGYRDHSAVETARFGLTGRFDLRQGRSLGVVGALAHVPYVESPGGIDASSATQDPQQTRAITVMRDAGKALTQGQLGLTYEQPIGDLTFSALASGTFRTLDNAIVPRYITLDRKAAYVRATLEQGSADLTWRLGVETKQLRDDRREFGYATGATPSDTPVTDQLENVRTQAFFGRVGLPLGRATLSGGVRVDRLRFEADDRLGTGDTGGRTFRAVSPSVGVVVPVSGATLFANVSSALETPTTTELGNRQDGRGGFNPSLQPEQSLGFEVGIRGGWASQRLAYDMTLFGLRVDDLILPFEVNDLTFFRNEGTSRHAGLEVALDWRPASNVSAALAYTYLSATFTDATTPNGTELDGLDLPGIPDHLLRGTVRWTPGRLGVHMNVERVSSYQANSLNTAPVDAYIVLDSRVQINEVTAGAFRLTPFVALNNVFDARYTGSVVINAFGGRYYEPAAGRHMQAGLSVSL